MAEVGAEKKVSLWIPLALSLSVLIGLAGIEAGSALNKINPAVLAALISGSGVETTENINFPPRSILIIGATDEDVTVLEHDAVLKKQFEIKKYPGFAVMYDFSEKIDADELKKIKDLESGPNKKSPSIPLNSVGSFRPDEQVDMSKEGYLVLGVKEGKIIPGQLRKPGDNALFQEYNLDKTLGVTYELPSGNMFAVLPEQRIEVLKKLGIIP